MATIQEIAVACYLRNHLERALTMHRRKSLSSQASLTVLAALFTWLLIHLGMVLLAAPPVVAQPNPTSTASPAQIEALRTDSPRETLASFLRLRTELENAFLSYRADVTRQKADHISNLIAELASLIDLSAVPRVSRREIGRETTAYLLDILGRVGTPDLGQVPDVEGVAKTDGVASWRIPETPLYISRIGQGSRQGEFLFNERTVRVAPRFFRGIQALPLRSKLGITSWRLSLLQSAGPAIPPALVDAIPDSLKQTWNGTPIWKVLAVLVIFVFGLVLLYVAYRLTAKLLPDRRILTLVRRLVMPLVLLAAVYFASQFIDFQLIISGAFARFVDFIETLLITLACAWLFWLAIRIFFEWLILSPHIPEESLDANLLRLLAAFFGIVGVTIILAYGGEKLGLPVLSLLAGLGIGGIAVALAIRPTLENLIGGVILYMDKPVRVGDLCSFGDRMARVEDIGVRSTQLRGLDRTLISVPNAQFVDMELINWAKCDQMLVEETIGLRYETTPDQLRYLLVKLREMLHAHPSIDNNTVRVRFSGYGESSLDVTIRVYARTRDLNEFHAIREDILLRAYDVVSDAGSGFAFPSRTVYMSEDDGLDKKRATAAEKSVESWRKSGRLPFPKLPGELLKKIEDTLDYPPAGSPDAKLKKKRSSDAGKHDPSAEPISLEDNDQPDEKRAHENSKR